jgi:nicotinamide mononucleotide transporter
MQIVQLFWQQVQHTSITEWLAVLFGFAYLIFITKKNILAWPCAIIGSFFSAILCFGGQLYIEMILSLFYIAMAIWGWFSWSKTNLKTEENDYKIKQWKLKTHVLNVLIGSGLALIIGWSFDQYTNQVLPYLDAFITVFSIAATFMVTQKILENWIYWVFIDIASVQLFAYRGFYLVAFQMLVYSIIAIYGYYQWRKDVYVKHQKS